MYEYHFIANGDWMNSVVIWKKKCLHAGLLKFKKLRSGFIEFHFAVH